MLCELLPDDPENLGLLALMLFHDARRAARVDDHGSLVSLDEQDRSRWDRQQIDEGMVVLARALQSPDAPSVRPRGRDCRDARACARDPKTRTGPASKGSTAS